MDREEVIDGIVEMCKENISELEEKVSISWADMDRMRCPLSMTGTNIADEIQDCIDEFCNDHDLTEEEIENLDIDIEDDIFVKL